MLFMGFITYKRSKASICIMIFIGCHRQWYAYLNTWKCTVCLDYNVGELVHRQLVLWETVNLLQLPLGKFAF
jgi:hypothetical protein